MTRGGRKKTDPPGQRRCIASGAERPQAEMIRFVLGPDGTIVPDLEGKLPGRGIWVGAESDLLDRAIKRNLFARSAKAPAAVPPDLRLTVEALLVRRVTDLISLARKAGQAVAGYEKVRSLIDEGRASALFQATDGSERGKTKVKLPTGMGPTIQCLTAGELGLSFGRERVIHAALGHGGLAARIVEDAGRLAGLRASIGEPSPERTIDSHERQ